MINHVRTLLMNVDGLAPVPPWAVGEELVPAGYRAARPDAALAAARAALFGAAPDRSGLNYRLAQYMDLLHATDLVTHVLAADPRFTYLPGEHPDLFADDAFTPAVAGPPGVPPLIVQGDPYRVDASGRLYYSYAVTVVADGSLSVADEAGAVVAAFDYATHDGLGDSTVPLGGSGYGFIVPSAPVGTTWRVSFHVRPGAGPELAMANARKLNGAALLKVFGTSQSEPRRTFRNLFATHAEEAYNLGAFLLATAARTEELLAGTAS